MTNKQLTEKQRDFLIGLVAYIRKEGRPPTMREMLKVFDLKSPRSVGQYIDALEASGYVKRSNGARNIQLLKAPPINKSCSGKTVLVPVVGSAPCGLPLLAQQNIDEHISVSLKLAKPPHNYFILRAIGDSMNKAGIENVDRVLVRQQNYASNGQIIVALIDDEATIKRFKFSKGVVVLEPDSSNPRHHPILLERDFQVQGVVVEIL